MVAALCAALRPLLPPPPGGGATGPRSGHLEPSFAAPGPAPDRELEPEINRFQVRVWQDGNPWIEPYLR